MAAIYPLNLYWNNIFQIVNGVVVENNHVADATIFMNHSMSFSDLEISVYGACGGDRSAITLNFVLVWSDESNARRYVNFQGDMAMPFLHACAHRRPELYVTFVQIQSTHHASTSEQHEEEYNDNREDNETDPWDEDSEEYVPSSEDEDESDNTISSSSSGNFVYNDIGSWDQSIDDDAEMPKMWDESVENIGLGTEFRSKADAMAAVSLWSSRRGVTFHTVDSRRKSWAVECITRSHKYPREQLHGIECAWSIRASLQNHTGLWKMVKWTEQHNCIGVINGNPSRNVTSTDIARLIMDKIIQIPNYPVKFIQLDVTNRFGVQVSYKKAWHGRRKALEFVFGNWESNFRDLPNYLLALQTANPDTRIRYKFTTDTKNSPIRKFRYLFWAFGPAVQSVQVCIPVVTIDATHLRGSYKGKLIVAVTRNADNKLLPVAFAVVDEETTDSWKWFLKYLRLYVIGGRKTCFISDRHPGILAAFEIMFQKYPEMGVHRFCLQHIKSNLYSHYHVSEIKVLCLLAGKMLQERKYIDAWAKLADRSTDAHQWLRGIGLEKWTLYHDGGYRWGVSTTNWSESFNHVLKNARFLPIRALVESTFEKTVQLFQKNLDAVGKCMTTLAPEPDKIFDKWRKQSLAHKVLGFDQTTGVFQVRTRPRESRPGKGGNVHVVEFLEKKCTCGKWQTYRIPCSHAQAVASALQMDPTTLVSRFYTRDGWRAQYQGRFTSVLGRDSWPELAWRLRTNDERTVHHTGPGRRRVNRRRGTNDYSSRRVRNTQVCNRCQSNGHNARVCPLSHPASDRTPINYMYDRYGDRI